jgi:glycosyltransferase involved in cell wall biosynthesis
MARRPLVSVIIPTYNRAHVIGRAIESALMQTYPSIEVIVVDDGSTDETGKVLWRYGSGLRTISQSNAGPAVARNMGIGASHGEFVAFLDSDDVWHPTKIEQQVSAVSRFGDGCGSCFTDAAFAGASSIAKTAFQLAGLSLGEVSGKLDDAIRFVAEPPGAGPRMWIQSMLVRAEAARRVGGFDPQMRYGEDEEFCFRLAMVTGFCYIGVPLVTIDRGCGRHTGIAESWDHIDFRLTHQQYSLEKRLRLCATLPNHIRQLTLRQLRSVYSEWANWYLKTGRFSEASEAVSKAAGVRLSPGIVLKWILLKTSPGALQRVVRCRG